MNLLHHLLEEDLLSRGQPLDHLDEALGKDLVVIACDVVILVVAMESRFRESGSVVDPVIDVDDRPLSRQGVWGQVHARQHPLHLWPHRLIGEASDLQQLGVDRHLELHGPVVPEGLGELERQGLDAVVAPARRGEVIGLDRLDVEGMGHRRPGTVWRSMPGSTAARRASGLAGGCGDSEVDGVLAALAARDDLAHRLREEFDHEQMEQAMAHVRRRVAPRTWEAFRLTALEGLSGAEAADRFDMKVSRVLVA